MCYYRPAEPAGAGTVTAQLLRPKIAGTILIISHATYNLHTTGPLT
jgi:hypothetical protein